MEANDFIPYVTILTGSIGGLNALIFFLKWWHKKYLESQNTRIDQHIISKTQLYDKRIGKLEYKIKVIIAFFIPKDKLDILKEGDQDE